MIRFYLDDKSPDEDIVYTIDWTKYLGQDTLTGAPTATILDPVAGSALIDTLSLPDNKHVNFFARGGTLGDVVRALIHVDTQGGQHLDAEVIFGIR